MTKQAINSDPFRKIWDLFSSVKLTVVLLLTLALTSIIGTLIPQNESPQAYLKAFGAFLYRFYDILGFFDLYHSWWFQFLILLLAINVLVCSLDRLPGVWKIAFVKVPPFNIDRFKQMATKEVFSTAIPFDQLSQQAEAFISNKFGYYRSERVFGKFRRSFALPAMIRADSIKAGFKNGVLRISIPKPEEEKPKQINVNVD